MKTIYIVDLEPVETRYTAQWKKFLPEQMQTFLGEEDYHVQIISGGEVPQTTTPGAFLNFAGTNSYKSQQMLEIANLVASGTVKDGDYFLYTDAWNPTVIQLKYMAELLGINIKIGGMWHAGSYDPADFLGRMIGAKPWVRYAEASMFECYDHNFYATRFHVNLFAQSFLNTTDDIEKNLASGQMQIVGWPMEYLKNTLAPYKGKDKENIVLFPHRVAPEKQPEIFEELKKQLPEYEFVVAQDKQLSKDEYHELLAKSKIVFSANLQETLGIGAYEGSLVGALPLVPDRLSYYEMYTDDFKYPNECTINHSAFQDNSKVVVDKIKDMIENYDEYKLKNQELFVKLDQFFDGTKLYQAIKDSVDAV
jgi:glycosyltransferase involved in cell wall biosynthesis